MADCALATKLVGVVLLDDTDGQGIARPGLKHLAIRTGLALTSVRRAVAALIGSGLLECTQPRIGRGNCSEYRWVPAQMELPLAAEKGSTVVPFLPPEKRCQPGTFSSAKGTPVVPFTGSSTDRATTTPPLEEPTALGKTISGRSYDRRTHGGEEPTASGKTMPCRLSGKRAHTGKAKTTRKPRKMLALNDEKTEASVSETAPAVAESPVLRWTRDKQAPPAEPAITLYRMACAAEDILSQPYLPAWGRDGKAVKLVLAQLPAADLLARWETYIRAALLRPNGWEASHLSIASFCANHNSYARGLGNVWADADKHRAGF